MLCPRREITSVVLVYSLCFALLQQGNNDSVAYEHDGESFCCDAIGSGHTVVAMIKMQ